MNENENENEIISKDLFEEVFNLNKLIFDYNIKYNSKEYWKNKLNMNGRIYLERNKKGYLFIYQKIHQINNIN